VEKEFIDLIELHKGILHKVCNIYFFNHYLKDDYYQEILIRAWKAFPSFKGKSAFATWLYRVALNSAIDIIRKQSLLPEHASLTDKEYTISDPEKQNESEQAVKLYEAISRLTDIEKAIILLYLDDYLYKEIGEMIGISESNAGVKIKRIKEKLIKILNNERE
jgi:RNA polymerase sigma-70 factor, ECF subfamily